MWQRNFDPVKVWQVLLFLLGKQEGVEIIGDLVKKTEESEN